MADDSGTVVQGNTNNVAEGNAENADGQQQQQARPNGWAMIKTLVVRMVFIYFIASLFRRNPQPAQTTGADGKPSPAARPSSNVFDKFTNMDMYVYVSEQEEFTDFKNEKALFWFEQGLIYGDWTSGDNNDGSFEKSGKIEASETVQNNGSLFIHVYFVKEGKSPDPTDRASKLYSKKYTAYRSKRLNKFKKRRFHTTVNLLTGQTDVHPDLVQKENASAFEILSHWHPNLTINLLDDHSPWIPGSVPQPLDEYIDFVPGSNKYYPIVYLNDYWNLNADYMPINDTTKLLNLTVTYTPMSLFKWQLYAAQGMRNKWVNMLGSEAGDDEEDQDSLKMAFLETSPYLLGMTIVVSILHSVFEFLAFKNDIQFWKSRKSLEGLSVRSVFFNVIQSLIVLLYIMDNETNTVVKISVFVGLCIEIWKINKVVNAKIDRENPIFGFIPRVSLSEKSTYTESQTKEFDILAFRYLSWLLYPLLAGYMVYSLVYQEHKGWYSWVLSMLYGFLLTFGFIMMTPQLFINYKLKSVAHLPWRMLTYKALNTFIDDIFAFVIKMPTLYRLGCLRDDVIFFIYLYQRYIYSVDPKRVNEFGTSQEMMDSPGEVAEEEGGGGEQQALTGKEEETEENQGEAKEGSENGDVKKTVEEKKND
ncbi:cleft lip and palate transmembrane protein 1 homolog isoform X2 [Aplysia californica]|uniref:Cleft lip and palate transmembrane protein 1 homolog isoform X2 n=1 Tax=Aplysia californica TaxID=6500 RepID=A0ABM0JT44_APLCA|nr:cleft lip and palate transmembrane protein 1 homolog isoform X2 [Aplysia californica]